LTYAPQSLPQEAGATKHCSGCGNDLPPSSFYARSCGKLSSRCRLCTSTANAARQRGQTLGRFHDPERVRIRAAHAERRKREQEAREIARDYRRAQRAEAAARVDYLASVLNGTAAHERIVAQEGWEAVTSELLGLWHRSGSKVCEVCRETVSPKRMQPPGPANFYPGHCHGCAGKAFAQHSLATFGRLPRARSIPMRDGTVLTVGELARRHRQRQPGRRVRSTAS
jgi:hypothetical protein